MLSCADRNKPSGNRQQVATKLLLFAPMLLVLWCFNRYGFRETGRINLELTTTCLSFVMILVTNTVVC
jgi:hypothetical protein